MDQDRDSWVIAQKALNIILIIAICFINILVIARQVRKHRFYGNPKLLTIISLAVGDVVLALFPLVVLTNFTFGNDSYLLSCGLNVSVSTYMDYLIHFVYSVGLILLGAEVFFRHKIHTLLNKSVVSMAATFLPWITGLVVVVPLHLANMDFEVCGSEQSPVYITTVSVFAPTALALITIIIFSCVYYDRRGQREQTTDSRESLYIPNVAGSNYVNCALILPKGQGRNKCAPGLPCVLKNTNTSSDYVNQNTNTYSDYVNQSTNTSSDYVNVVMDGNDPWDTRTSTGRKELQRLLVIAVVFAIMVVPYAAITLSLQLLPKTEFIVTQVLGWLMVARCIVTPVIMLTFADL